MYRLRSLLRARVRGGHRAASLGPQSLEPTTLVLHLLLNRQEALDQRLGPRRAAGHVDVDGNHLIDPLEHRVAELEQAAAVRARAHRDDVLGLGHLLIKDFDARGHLIGDGAGDDDQVRLARRGARGGASAFFFIFPSYNL